MEAPKYQVLVEKISDGVASQQAEGQRREELAAWHADDRKAEMMVEREVKVWTAG